MKVSGQYDRFIEAMQVDSIANLYSPDGSLGDIATGRDSIKHFLVKFKDIKVLSQKSATDSLFIQSDSAVQYGKYTQKDILPNKDTVTVKGLFITHWKWIDGDGWRIQKMSTAPLK